MEGTKVDYNFCFLRLHVVWLTLCAKGNKMPFVNINNEALIAWDKPYGGEKYLSILIIK